MLGKRHTVVAQGPLAFGMHRLAAADASTLGLELTSLPLLAARLAGGFLRPANSDDLYPGISAALEAGGFAELQPLCGLPGTTRAVARTLRKLWEADVALEDSPIPRICDLALIESRVRAQLAPGAKLPRDLRDLALGRVALAPRLLGDVELNRVQYVPRVWQPLIVALCGVVRVRWRDPGTADVGWFPGEILRSERAPIPAPQLVSCANPRSEVIESLRWARMLLSSGKARAHEIAICGASTEGWDDHFLTLARDSDIPIHMSNGVPALSTDDGQACAALADVLLNGLSQERVRRLFAHAIGVSPRLRELPHEWSKGVSRDAGLFQVDHWRRALEQAHARSGLSSNVTEEVMSALSLLSRGVEIASTAGTEFLRPSARRLWMRALSSAPAQALSLSLQDLRLSHSTDPGACVVWCPAHHLIGAPRPWVWLLGMTSGMWPERSTEDPLLPDHIYDSKLLEPEALSERQRRSYELIRSNASSGCFISRSRRRSALGGLLPASPLLTGSAPGIDLRPGRIPKHAFSEADRLLARPQEAAATPRLQVATSCWSNWLADSLTPHDGLVASDHSVIIDALSQPQSATSLRRLLRDPLSFVWQHGLGWHTSHVVSEPLELDARSFGELVHEILRRSVEHLEPTPGLTRATADEINSAIERALSFVREQWPLERAIPPHLLWLHTLQLAQRLARKALTADSSKSETRCWTEVPFGSHEEGPGQWPWDPRASVQIPGTRVPLRGSIDRLDLRRTELAGERLEVRVTDYKTGSEPPRAAEISIDGGNELQRVIYAIAASQLLTDVHSIAPTLLYLREDVPRSHELVGVDNVIAQVSEFVAEACNLLQQGNVLPGLRRDENDEYAIALPAAREFYFKRKDRPLRRAFGKYARWWSAR